MKSMISADTGVTISTAAGIWHNMCQILAEEKGIKIQVRNVEQKSAQKAKEEAVI
jgi:hypothetical protein